MPPNPLINLLVNPGPAAVNPLLGLPAPTIRSFTEVVVAEPLFAVVPLPLAAELTSRGFTGSNPPYSSTFTLGEPALWLNVTVTLLLPAVAEAIFFA